MKEYEQIWLLIYIYPRSSITSRTVRSAAAYIELKALSDIPIKMIYKISSRNNGRWWMIEIVGHVRVDNCQLLIDV